MTAWEKGKDASKAPKWLSAEDKAKAILTERGWEIPRGRAGNYEILAAFGGGEAAPDGANDAPAVNIPSGSGFATLTGTASVPIEPYTIQVSDLEDTTSEDLAISNVIDLPAGLTLGSTGTYEFSITGTPSGATTGTISVRFTDGVAFSATVGIPYNIIA